MTNGKRERERGREFYIIYKLVNHCIDAMRVYVGDAISYIYIRREASIDVQ